MQNHPLEKGTETLSNKPARNERINHQLFKSDQRAKTQRDIFW